MNSLECALLDIENHDVPQIIYRAGGCIACDRTGYKNRLAVVEALYFDEEMDEIVARRGIWHELLRLAVSRGFRTLRQAGASRVLDGSTSMDEVARVIDLSGRKTKEP